MVTPLNLRQGLYSILKAEHLESSRLVTLVFVWKLSLDNDSKVTHSISASGHVKLQSDIGGDFMCSIGALLTPRL